MRPKPEIAIGLSCKEDEMPYFLVELSYENRDEINRLRPAHRDYIERLFNQQKVASAGRFFANSGSVFLYKVDLKADLTALVQADPYLEHKAAVIRSIREFEPGIAAAIEYVRK